jgi:hypothetical protein
VFELRCTSRQQDAHRTEERKVFYPCHPWFGLRVFVHEVAARGSVRVFRCAETAQIPTRCLEVPEWMFDRSACCGVTQVDSPRVDRAALEIWAASMPDTRINAATHLFDPTTVGAPDLQLRHREASSNARSWDRIPQSPVSLAPAAASRFRPAPPGPLAMTAEPALARLAAPLGCRADLNFFAN